jgi:hypothetical protein
LLLEALEKVREMFIFAGIDEQKTLDDAREKSEEEVVQVHWHTKAEHCEAKFRHQLYRDGYSVSGGSGKA